MHQLHVGDTALHLAAAAVSPTVVAALPRASADPNAENRRGAIALHDACDPRPRAGFAWRPAAQREIIERLVAAGSRIGHVEKAGAAPLHRAVRARSPEAVRCLLALGADASSCRGKRRTTPLELAQHSTGASGTEGTHAEQQEIIALLLAGGADPRATGARG